MANGRLKSFRGDLGWLHAREGHVGKPYWPGGQSGVTLDPGVDLGYADWKLVEKVYGPLLDEKQAALVRLAWGIRGGRAKALAAQLARAGVRISREQADEAMWAAALPYWEGAVKRWPVLAERGTPPEVQTAVLSLVYNRGVQNGHLEVLTSVLENRQWAEVGRLIAGMQQQHAVAGVRARRRAEGELILAAVVPQEAVA